MKLLCVHFIIKLLAQTKIYNKTLSIVLKELKKKSKSLKNTLTSSKNKKFRQIHTQI